MTKLLQRGPDYSQRRENRARLKNSLLKELWGEEVATDQGRETTQLHIPKDVRDLMERRMILIEDVRQVLDWAEETGFKLVEPSIRALLGSLHPDDRHLLG